MNSHQCTNNYLTMMAQCYHAVTSLISSIHARRWSPPTQNMQTSKTNLMKARVPQYHMQISPKRLWLMMGWSYSIVCMLASRGRLWRPNSRGVSCCFGKLGTNFSGNALPRVHSHSLGQEDTRTASVEDGLQKQARLQGCSTFWQCKPCLLVGEP